MKLNINMKWHNLIILALLLYLLGFLFITIRKDRDRDQIKTLFREYVEAHNKSYANDSEEYERRFGHFLTSLDEIDKLNSESPGPDKYRARYGINILSDMSKSEFENVHLSDERVKSFTDIQKNWPKYSGDDGEIHTDLVYERRKRLALPMHIDWREKGIIGPVKYQGLCGACWAFSTVGVIETMAAIKTGKLQELSVQEMIDCARSGNYGCQGGDICLLLNWLVKSDTRVQFDSSYPIQLIDGPCKIKNTTDGIKVKDYTCKSMVGNEEELLEMIATHGPVAVAVNAFSWQNYLGGVIQYHCTGTMLNHAVELVGYNLEAAVPYYIVKNSWGKDFGEDGYLKLAVGNNICGLATEVAAVDV